MKPPPPPRAPPRFPARQRGDGAAGLGSFAPQFAPGLPAGGADPGAPGIAQRAQCPWGQLPAVRLLLGAGPGHAPRTWTALRRAPDAAGAVKLDRHPPRTPGPAQVGLGPVPDHRDQSTPTSSRGVLAPPGAPSGLPESVRRQRSRVRRVAVVQRALVWRVGDASPAARWPALGGDPRQQARDRRLRMDPTKATVGPRTLRFSRLPSRAKTLRMPGLLATSLATRQDAGSDLRRRKRARASFQRYGPRGARWARSSFPSSGQRPRGDADWILTSATLTFDVPPPASGAQGPLSRRAWRAVAPPGRRHGAGSPCPPCPPSSPGHALGQTCKGTWARPPWAPPAGTPSAAIAPSPHRSQHLTSSPAPPTAASCGARSTGGRDPGTPAHGPDAHHPPIGLASLIDPTQPQASSTPASGEGQLRQPQPATVWASYKSPQTAWRHLGPASPPGNPSPAACISRLVLPPPPNPQRLLPAAPSTPRPGGFFPEQARGQRATPARPNGPPRRLPLPDDGGPHLGPAPLRACPQPGRERNLVHRPVETRLILYAAIGRIFGARPRTASISPTDAGDTWTQARPAACPASGVGRIRDGQSRPTNLSQAPLRPHPPKPPAMPARRTAEPRLGALPARQRRATEHGHRLARPAPSRATYGWYLCVRPRQPPAPADHGPHGRLQHPPPPTNAGSQRGPTVTAPARGQTHGASRSTAAGRDRLLVGDDGRACTARPQPGHVLFRPEHTGPGHGPSFYPRPLHPTRPTAQIVLGRQPGTTAATNARSTLACGPASPAATGGWTQIRPDPTRSHLFTESPGPRGRCNRSTNGGASLPAGVSGLSGRNLTASSRPTSSTRRTPPPRLVRHPSRVFRSNRRRP